MLSSQLRLLLLGVYIVSRVPDALPTWGEKLYIVAVGKVACQNCLDISSDLLNIKYELCGLGVDNFLFSCTLSSNSLLRVAVPSAEGLRICVACNTLSRMVRVVYFIGYFRSPLTVVKIREVVSVKSR
eukprot:1925608-Pleurochrysis_carterae.AAC.1